MNRPFLPVCLLALMLGACSSSSDSGGNTDGGTTDAGGGTDAGGTDAGGTDGGDGVTQIGVVRVSRTDSGFDSITLNARFNQFAPPVAGIDLPESYVPDTDRCEIISDGSLPTGTSTDVSGDIVFYFAAGASARDAIRSRLQADQAPLISAGSELVFTAPGGTFTELQIDEESSYQMPNGSVVGDAPPTLEIDIPGAEYPDFPAITIPVMAHVDYTDSSPNTSSLLDTGLQLSWQADTSTDSFIVLRGQARNLDVTPLAVVDVVCVLPDDGEFSLTDAQQEDVHTLLSTDASEPDTFTAFTFQRVNYQSVRSGNALLILQSVVAGE